MSNGPDNKSNNQELIHTERNGSCDSVKWRSPSVFSENLSELLIVNTVSVSNLWVDITSPNSIRETGTGTAALFWSSQC